MAIPRDPNRMAPPMRPGGDILREEFVTGADGNFRERAGDRVARTGDPHLTDCEQAARHYGGHQRTGLRPTLALRRSCG